MTHGGGGWTFSKKFTSPALMVLVRQSLEDSKQKDERINQLMNDKGVYRKALAPKGLLKKCHTI